MPTGRRKSRALAAVLCFLLGPIGYVYIGWKFAIGALLAFLAYAPICYGLLLILSWAASGLPYGSQWLPSLPLVIYAWTGAHYAGRWNQLVGEASERFLYLFQSTKAAMVFSVQVFTALVTWTVAVITVLYSFSLDSTLASIAVFFVGTPLLASLADVIMGFLLSGVIDRAPEDVKLIFS